MIISDKKQSIEKWKFSVILCSKVLTMEDIAFQEPSQTFSAPKKRNPKRLALLIIAIIIVVIFSVLITTSNLGKEKEEATTTTSTTITPTETPTPTEVEEDEEEDEEEEEDTPTPNPTSNPIDKESGLDRSKLSIEIQNGSGVAGVAGEASTILRNLGYKILTTGNADSFDYEDLTIRVKSKSSDFLSLLESDLEEKYTIGETSSDLSSSTSADALIIIGK